MMNFEKEADRMTIKEAAAQCRRNLHGSYNYQYAFSVLINNYRVAHPNHLNPCLKTLWAWVNDYLRTIGEER